MDEPVDKGYDESTSEEWLAGMIRYWRANHDDLRFGQWLYLVVSRKSNRNLFYIEDDELADLVLKGFET